MRTVVAAEAADLTAKARIRDAALYCFADQGFQVGLRAIAERAGVSVALITHHYGTKDALREVCDEHVLQRFSTVKLAGVVDPLATVRDAYADPTEASVLTVYIIRCFEAGAPAARQFYDNLVSRYGEVMAAATAAGYLKPSSNPELRDRILTEQIIGQSLVRFAINPPRRVEEFFTAAYLDNETLPLLIEMYTHGVMQENELWQRTIASMPHGTTTTEETA
ncbi:MAG: TetR family transcriptional regulator [Propionibacteriaceae bacterium]|jgi:AcrR family transcriptional regulator|nr:TetR family transcriptional regulator [Propionibacteriaceae bacterium]